MGNKYCHEKKTTNHSMSEISFVIPNISYKNDRPQLDTACFATFITERNHKSLGHYRVGEKLGIGSYGVVYIASHPSMSQQFAIKCVNKQKVLMSGHKKTMEHLLTEIEVMSTIKSENIIHLYDIYQDQTNYYLIIDYCNRGDFLNYLKTINRNWLEEKDAIYFLKQIRDAFIDLRKNHVMHRDIKLENLFIHNRTLKIGDFGFAKIHKDTTNSILGSKYTMAPEILIGVEKSVSYGPKCDLWSIGCVLYEMLFGCKLPIENDGTIQSISKSMRSFNESELRFPRPISEPTQDLLRRLLTKNVNERIDFESFFNHSVFKMNNEWQSSTKDLFSKTITFIPNKNNYSNKIC